MSDAKVIRMDGDRPRTPGARSVLVGADRASGERARRRMRTTPLLAGPSSEDARSELAESVDEVAGAAEAEAETDRSDGSAAERSAVRPTATPAAAEQASAAAAPGAPAAPEKAAPEN